MKVFCVHLDFSLQLIPQSIQHYPHDTRSLFLGLKADTVKFICKLLVHGYKSIRYLYIKA